MKILSKNIKIKIYSLSRDPRTSFCSLLIDIKFWGHKFGIARCGYMDWLFADMKGKNWKEISENASS